MSTALASYMSRYSTYASAIRAIKPNMTFMLGELASNSDPTLTQILGSSFQTGQCCQSYREHLRQRLQLERTWHIGRARKVTREYDSLFVRFL